MSKEECGICFTEIEQRGKIDSCDHLYCFDCIEKWSNSCNTCPLCRERFHTITRLILILEESVSEPKTLEDDVEIYTPDVISVPHRNQRVPTSDISYSQPSVEFFQERLTQFLTAFSRMRRQRSDFHSSRTDPTYISNHSDRSYIYISE